MSTIDLAANSSLSSHSLSSTRLGLNAGRGTVHVFMAVLRIGWKTLLPLYAMDVLASQFFTYATEYLREIGREDLSYIALIASLELFFTLIWSSIWMLAVSALTESLINPQANPRPTLSHAMKAHFNQLVIEQIRSIAAILWRAPLFIVPSLIQYVRLAFVPFIVIFDPEYARGERDALEASRALSRGRFWLLWATAIATLVVPWIAEQLVQGERGSWIWVNPLGVTIGAALSFLITCATTVFLYLLFRLIAGPATSDSPVREGYFNVDF